ncbi:hypothetical protein MGSAQ_002040 [marine sediment metagenome]|uniref:Uncharacterized protein n=1 Tax=marine sediment metagenome TaxID=412755 RepID=A0A1B6NSL1_9ZZZZ
MKRQKRVLSLLFIVGLMLKLPHTALQISLRHLHYRRFVLCLEQF